MALSFIGKPISLISHSDVRYRGILAGIDPHASTIQLSNVFSMGTESRRPPAEFIPPVSEPYQYIIFKAAEVKDLQVDQEPVAPRPDVHADPAVMASAPLAATNYSPYAPPAPAAMPPQMQQPVQQQQQPYPQRPPQQQGLPQQQMQPPQHQMAPQPTASQVAAGVAPPVAVAPALQQQQQQQQQRRPNAVQTAATSLQNVERALGDLRVSDGSAITAAAVVSGSHHHPGERGGRGGRRGGRGGHRNDAPTEIKVPTTDFDFETMNAKFDKAALAASAAGKSAGSNPNVNPSAGPLSAAAAGVVQTPDAVAAEEGTSEGVKDKSPAAYNPQKSFFDTLSSNASTNAMEGGGRGGRGRRGGGGPGGPGGGGHGGAGGRNRREEEREKNVATFGEPGGVGLMGPGAYVGGWGGYGRRGGGGRGRGRGGRGGGHGPRVGDNQPVAARG
ncbi:Scd6-like Sm domain-containing protein [Coprinopsis sp. MPI-PUGE-AT-0042]|nr:Scd6-like Sm domain-containing protein [Coprinopsis sp. MPI-PUGE-AT-0042]